MAWPEQTCNRKSAVTSLGVLCCDSCLICTHAGCTSYLLSSWEWLQDLTPSLWKGSSKAPHNSHGCKGVLVMGPSPESSSDRTQVRRGWCPVYMLTTLGFLASAQYGISKGKIWICNRWESSTFPLLPFPISTLSVWLKAKTPHCPSLEILLVLSLISSVLVLYFSTWLKQLWARMGLLVYPSPLYPRVNVASS